MDWDKVKQQRRAEAKVKMPDTSNSNPKITDDDVNGFLNSIDSATKDVEKYLTEPTYSTRDERSGYRSTIRNQRNKANEIALHVAQNRNKYSNSDEILNYLDNYIESLKGLATGVSKYGDFYSSNFKSEDDYNNYLDSIKKQEELLNFDTAAANKELSGLEAVRNNIEYDVAYDTARSSRFGVSARKNIGVDQTERENLDRRISELKQKITLASRAQNAEKLRNNALNDIEFKKYSDQGASIKNPSMRDAEGSMTVFGKPIGGEDIGNIVTYSRDNWKEIAMGGASGGTVQGNAIYKYMTAEEVDIYNYYLAKDGQEKAAEYLDSITENLNMRQASGIYDELEDKTALQYVFGVSAGLDQFGSGVRNTVKAIKGDDSYTPASSTQIASGMIREGLADDGAKLPEWMGGGSIGQLGYDAITNTTNNLPSMLVGSIFGPGAGAITMGASVYGNAYSEMINLGYDKNQANSYAALTAASEAGLQYLLGGISSLGGKVSNNVLKRIISNVDNAFAKIAIQYGGEMMSEFTEEYLQDVLDPYFKNLATGENNAVSLLNPDAVYSGILGALNAGASNATFGAINSVANNSYLNNYYKETYGESIDSLIQEGLATEKDSKSYSLAEKLKAKTESGEDISGAAIRKLVEANEKQFNNADTAKIESAAEQRLKSLGETGDSAKIAKALTKQVKGEVLSVSEQKAFDNSKYGQRVMNELSPENIRSGSYSSSWAENIGTDRINADLYNLAQEAAGVTKQAAPQSPAQTVQNVPQVKQEVVGAKVQTSETTSQPKAKNAVQSEFKASESGKTINNITGSESDVAEIVKIKNGEMTLKLENGETVNAKNVSYGSQGEALIYETVAKLDNISAPAADVLVKAYNSSGNISADVYARGIEEAYRYGKYNIPVSEMLERGAFAAELTAEQRNKAYRLGQMFGGKSIAKAQAIRTQSTMGQVKKAVSESKKGRVHFDGNMESLNERQRTSVSALEKISEALGVDFYLFESAEVNGKRQGANGWYDPKDGSIHIDIYAGQNGEATMLFTAAHELTHFIKQWSPAKFKVLANFLMQEYGREGVSVDSLVRAQQAKAARNKRKISYDAAYEEVIADSMETMLADGNVMEKLAQLKAKDKTLWEKIKSFIDDLVKKIKEVYAGLTPNSEEGQYVAEMKDSIEKIQQLFTEGLIEAGDNYQSSKKSAADSNKFSLRENVEETKDLVAVHNMQVSELEKSLDLGGLPMPSIAIIKAKSGHSEYGDVSLVFSKDTIDPKANRNNKVYGGDAWTPVYPSIEYKVNEKNEKKINNKYYELSRKIGYEETRPLYNYVYEMEDALNKAGGEKELLNRLYDDTDMMQVFLMDIGKGKVETVQKETRTELSEAEVEENEFFIKELGESVIDEIMVPPGPGYFGERKKLIAKYETQIREAYQKYLSEKLNIPEDGIQNVLEQLRPVDLMNFVRDAYLYRKNGKTTIKVEPDYRATEEAIKKAAFGEEYRKWVDSLFKGVEQKSGIRNNTDYFTNSGNRRSWEALHWENNLENVVKVMKSQKNGEGLLFSGLGIWGVSAKEYGSIAEIKADSGRLQAIPEEEYKKIRESFGERFSEIAHSIMDRTESNQFIAADNAMECIVDSVRKSKTKSGVLNNLKQYRQLNVTETAVNDIISLVSDISNMPTTYFEAKPQRAVGFDEVATVILPDSTSKETKSRLSDMRINYVEYESGNEQARLEALNSVEGVRFSFRDSDGNELSKEQQEYFKDSKVRDENGNLLVVYHGTDADFTVFNPSIRTQENRETGIWFSDSEKISASYSHKKPMAAYLNIKNPLIVDGKGRSSRFLEAPAEAYDKDLGYITNYDSSTRARKGKYWDTIDYISYAKDKGYDGVIFKNIADSGIVNTTDEIGTVYAAFDSNQAKSVDNKTPTTDPDIRYSDRDSDGRKLSEQQQSYFKDSKVRDEEGNLLVVYHGTRKADFTKFSRNYNFFTDSKDMADSYSQNGELYTGYLDIKNPFTIDAKGEKWSKIPIDTVTKKLLDSYGSSTFKEKGQWRTTPADIAAAIQDGIDEGEFDYDGIIIKNVDDTGSYYKDRDSIIANDYIVFNSKQFKNADNKAPTADPDIRYSLREVEPVQPSSDKWARTLTTSEVMERFPNLWNVAAEESETRNPTQISGTVKSYRKIYDFLKNEGFDGKILDASSGLGYGTRAGIEEYGFDVEDIEPYPDKSYHPKYKDYSKLNKKYDVIISNAVLNVIPQDQRDALVVKMGELLNEGGRIFVNVRGKDVENASSKVAINKNLMEYYISSTGSYQKGFTKPELVAYLQDALGDGFTVKASNMFGAVSAVVEKDGASIKYSDRDYSYIGESALFQDRIDIADRNRAVILQNKAERLEKELAELERAYGEVIRREYEQNIKPDEGTSKRAARINEKAAKRFMNEVGATFYVAKTEREQYLLPIINEIIDKGPEISDSEGLIEELYRTAYRHSSEYIVQDSERDQNLKGYIRKTSIYVDPGTRSDVGDYNRFCKSNMGSLKLTSDTRALSLDEFYEEVKNAAPDMFSGTSDGAEQLYELSAFMQKRTESIGDYMSEDEFVDWAMNGENSLDTGLENLFDTTIGTFISEATRKEKERTNAANINRAIENVRSAVEHYGAAQGYAREEGFLAGQIEQGAQMAKELRQKQESFNRKAEGYEKSIEAKRKKISELRAQRDELLEKARTEKREALANARQKAIEAQKEIITRYQESRKKAVEGREQTAMRNKVKGVVAELNHLLLNGTKDRHVMIGLQKAVAEALDAVNMDTIGADERVAKYDALIAKANDPDVIASLTATRDRIRRQGDNLSEKIAQLKAAYGDIKNSDDPLVANGYDEVIASKIDSVVSTVGNTPLRAMSTKQLEDVYDMYRMVLTRIRGANESFKSAKKEAISVLGNRVMMEVEHVGGKHPYRLKGSEKIEGFMWNNLKPVYAFEKIGSKTLTEVYNNVRAGEDTFAKDVTEAREFFVKENRKYHYDKWNMDKTFSFKSKTGQSFKLTIPQIMSLYAYSKRNQADKHLELGGFVFDSNIEVTQKKKGIPVKYTVNTATAHNISKETLGDIIGKLTAEQKAFVDEMQDFLSSTMGEKGNEVSLAMYGVKLFKEKHYFPLKSAKQFMFEQNETAGEVKLKNSGFSKETVVNASNPIILSNFMDVWANHVNDMSMYHSFVLPLEDFNRVFNYKTPNSESLDTESVKQFIQNAYGKEANAYIKQLLTDLNGGAVSDPRETTAKRLISNFKKAAVFSSASVVIQQPSAIGRALAIIDPKYFVGGKIGARGHSALWAEVKKYAPVAIIKEMGYFDTNMGRSTVDFITAKEYKGFSDKAKGLVTDSGYRDEVLSKAPALADEITWCAIWNAVKRETRATHKELTPGSEEFLKAAGARFTEVITKTQVYDSILSRSANMRSKSTFMSMWTSFMGEPTTSINMIEDAIRQGKRGNKKYAAKAIGSVFTSMVLNSLLVSLVYAARDDDEDETYLEKYLASLTSEIIEGINPLTYLPFFKDVWSSLQGFDIERADMSLITKLIESTQKAYKVYTEDTEDMTEDELLEHDKKVVEANWSIVDSISSLVGLPVKNLRRDINGAINLVRTAEKDLGGRKTTKGSLADKIEEAVRKSVPILGWGKGESRGDRLYDAIIAGDETYVNRIKDSIGDDQKYANMRFATLRDNDPRIKEAAQTAFGGDYAGAKKIAEAIIAEGNFSRNEVFSVISTELTKLKNAGKENSYEEKDKLLFGANDFFNAAKNNNLKDANAIRDELIAKKQDEGYLKWEAINSVESSFTSEAKKSYLDGDITAQKAKDILMKYGGKESVSEAETEIKKWNFELKQGYTWSARARGYRLGDISKQELISAVMDIEGDDEEGAELYIRFLDLAKNNEDIEITSYDASSYFKYAEPAGIEVATYLDYKDEASKCKGEKDEYGNTIRNTKKAQILLVIDALPITNEQKDALYFANGWAQSTLKDAPWH